MINEELVNLGKLCICCAVLGLLTSFMDNEAQSYCIDLLGGIGIWYYYFGDILGKF